MYPSISSILLADWLFSMKAFKLDISFVILFLCFMLSPYQKEFLKLLCMLLIHEFGHILFIVLFRIRIKSIRLYALGFLMDIENKNMKFYQEFFIYSGGILFNLLSLLIFQDNMKPYIWAVILINLLPIFPLDGNRILNALLSVILPYRIALYATHIFALISLCTISVLFFRRMDCLLLLNILYLWIIECRELKNIEYGYSSFVLYRYLYAPAFRKKRVRFRVNNDRYLYKYAVIYTELDGKRITQSDILALKYGGR